jgi:hypothetical protein
MMREIRSKQNQPETFVHKTATLTTVTVVEWINRQAEDQNNDVVV